jgi:hypothetical protein
VGLCDVLSVQRGYPFGTVAQSNTSQAQRNAETVVVAPAGWFACRQEAHCDS